MANDLDISIEAMNICKIVADNLDKNDREKYLFSCLEVNCDNVRLAVV